MSYRIARSRLWQMLTLAGNRWRRPARVASRRIGLFSLFVFLSMGIQVPGSRGLGPSTALGEPIPIADIQHEGEVDFAKEILPILRKKCLACHNATDAEGELVLESPQTILQGGSEGPVIAAGKPMESRLLKLASFQDDPAMPPEDNDVGAAPLTPEELGLIKQWIQQGAKGEIVAGSRSIQWHPIPSRMTPIYAVGLSPDGAYVAAGRANDIILYRTADQQSLGRLSDPALKGVVPGDEPPPAHLDLVQSLSFGPRGQLLASGGYRTVKIWRPAPRLTATWQLGEGSASAASLQPLGPGATVASAEGSVAAYDLTAKDADSLAEIPLAVTSNQTMEQLAMHPSGEAVAGIAKDGRLLLWSIDTPASPTEFAADSPLASIFWLSATHLAAGTTDGKLLVWSITLSPDTPAQLAEASSWRLTDQPIRAIAPLAANRAAVAAGNEALLVDWKQEQVQRRLDHQTLVTALASSVDGRYVVTLADDTPSRLWASEDGKLLATLASDPQLIQAAADATYSAEVAARIVAALKKDHQEATKREQAEQENVKKIQEGLKKATEDQNNKTKVASDTAMAAETAAEALQEAETALKTLKQQLADAADDAARKPLQEMVNAQQKTIEEAKKKKEEADKAAKKAADEKTAADKTVESQQRSLKRAEEVLADAHQAIAPLTEAVAAAEEHSKQRTAQQQEAAQHRDEVQLIARQATFAADNRSVTIMTDKGTLLTYRAADGLPFDRIDTQTMHPLALVASGPQTVRAVAEDRRVRDLSLLPHWELSMTIGSATGDSPLIDRVTALAFSPDGERLAVGGGDPSRSGQLLIFRVSDGQLVREIPDAHSDTVLGIAFSPDGSYLASSGADRFMKVFRVEDGQLQRTFEGHTHHVLDVAWSADGRTLVTGGADKVVKIWDFNKGTQIRTISGFGKEVTSVEFLGTGDQFLATCGDQTLYRCGLDGKREGVSKGSDFLYSLATSRSGQAAFGGHDSIVRIINKEGKLQAELK